MRAVKMAAEEKWKGWASKQQKEAERGREKEPAVLLGRQLGEPGRFAYAALCGISLAWLFPENEQSSFRTEFIKGFVTWLDLPDAVLSAMTAFAGGLGGEGTETFTEMLLEDPILKENPLLITHSMKCLGGSAPNVQMFQCLKSYNSTRTATEIFVLINNLEQIF